MKKFNEKLSDYIAQNFNSKKEFAETLKVDRQSVIYFTSLTNPRNPSIDFLLKFIDYDPNVDLNYFLKNFIDTPSKLTRINNTFEVNENNENYNDQNKALLEEVKSLNEKIIQLFDK